MVDTRAPEGGGIRFCNYGECSYVTAKWSTSMGVYEKFLMDEPWPWPLKEDACGSRFCLKKKRTKNTEVAHVVTFNHHYAIDEILS